jgi:glyoxylase-like metal-dependent hydrolase (beta-lactamase superfamily II)
MVVHHLNCGNMYPVGSLLLTGEGGFLDRAHVVCHCLLLELPDRLVLVDTGFGTADLTDPVLRFGTASAKLLNIEQDQTRTAIRQIAAMGYEPGDVRDIILTHLDFDHAGGLPDFPLARVHVLDMEHDTAVSPRTFAQRARYCGAQFAHGVNWALHTLSGNDRWFGFEYIRALPDVQEEIYLVPLLGHSRGHCGVAVKDGERWLLHCGDAVLSHQELDPVEPDAPLGIKLFEKFISDDEEAVEANQALLRQLLHENPDQIQAFCSHDPKMLDWVPPSARQAAFAV